MAIRSSTTSRNGLLTAAFSLLCLTTAVDALTQKYCSSQNTGSGTQSETWDFQSNGHCRDTCGSNYAFAIVKGKECWCSDYAPAQTESVSACSQTCPGYPYEYCGSSTDNLYSYIALGKAPVGTAGASSRSAPTSLQVAFLTVTNQAAITSSPTSSSDSTDSTDSTTITSSSSSGTSKSSPVTTTIVNSVGSVVTITTTPTLPASTEKIRPTKGINGGVVAGIVIAVVIGLVLVGGLFFFLWFRRYRQRDTTVDGDMVHAPQRMNSQMSKSGLLGATAVPTFAFRRTTPPQTADTPSVGGTSPSERRNSRPFLYDQRLNPQALMIHEDLSRNSINTIDDGRDYGRKLNVTNPDPDHP